MPSILPHAGSVPGPKNRTKRFFAFFKSPCASVKKCGGFGFRLSGAIVLKHAGYERQSFLTRYFRHSGSRDIVVVGKIIQFGVGDALDDVVIDFKSDRAFRAGIFYLDFI